MSASGSAENPLSSTASGVTQSNITLTTTAVCVVVQYTLQQLMTQLDACMIIAYTKYIHTHKCTYTHRCIYILIYI